MRANTVWDSGWADLALAAPAGPGTCFAGHRFRTSRPWGIQVLYGCGPRSLLRRVGGGDPAPLAVTAGLFLAASQGRGPDNDWKNQPPAAPALHARSAGTAAAVLADAREPAGAAAGGTGAGGSAVAAAGGGAAGGRRGDAGPGGSAGRFGNWRYLGYRGDAGSTWRDFGGWWRWNARHAGGAGRYAGCPGNGRRGCGGRGGTGQPPPGELPPAERSLAGNLAGAAGYMAMMILPPVADLALVVWTGRDTGRRPLRPLARVAWVVVAVLLPLLGGALNWLTSRTARGRQQAEGAGASN